MYFLQVPHNSSYTKKAETSLILSKLLLVTLADLLLFAFHWKTSAKFAMRLFFYFTNAREGYRLLETVIHL